MKYDVKDISLASEGKKLIEWADKDMPVLKKLDFVKKYMVHNSGHGMMTENPKEFYSKLHDFIESI